MHSRMCFVDRPVHIEKGYEYVHTQTRHASWLFFPSWSKHIQNKSLPYGAGNTLKLLNQVIHFGFSGAKRGEWGNDPIHDYEKNHPSNPHSLPSTSKSSGIWIHHLICCLPSWVHTLLGWPQWRGGEKASLALLVVFHSEVFGPAVGDLAHGALSLHSPNRCAGTRGTRGARGGCLRAGWPRSTDHWCSNLVAIAAWSRQNNVGFTKLHSSKPRQLSIDSPTVPTKSSIIGRSFGILEVLKLHTQTTYYFGGSWTILMICTR